MIERKSSWRVELELERSVGKVGVTSWSWREEG